MSQQVHSAPAFGTQLIGQTEKALNAILARLLAGTGVDEPEWVVLNVTGGSEPVPYVDLATRATAVLKVPNDVAAQTIDQLVSRGLLALHRGRVGLTAQGEALLADVRAEVAAVTRRLWGDLRPHDLDTAGRVLATVLSRADGELAARAPRG